MNKFFAILIMCSLSLPVAATGVQEVETTLANTNNTEVMTTEEVEELNTGYSQEQNAVSVPESLPSRYKEPVSKKQLAKKFIIAMLCVAGTSIFLYGVLSVYNKIRDGFVSQSTSAADEETPLEAPSDLTEAVKTFVEKTTWNN